MEKLDLQTFRSLKQEIADYFQKYAEYEFGDGELSNEELEQFRERYAEVIKILSEHDLSDIDFEEWKGMYIAAGEDNPINFSKTKANIDFSIIEYDCWGPYVNLKGCKIKNFDFEKYDYSPEMFDEEFIKENEQHFLSPNIPEEIAEKFYSGKITLTDTKNYPELAHKIQTPNLEYGLRDIYEIVGREEFLKLDAEFIDETKYDWGELLRDNTNLRSAEKIMPQLYEIERNRILGKIKIPLFSLPHRQDKLGEEFKKENPDLFISEEVPEEVRNAYYRNNLTLEQLGEYLQYFEGKQISQAFNYKDEKILRLYGDEIYQLVSNYRPLINKIVNDYSAMGVIEVPDGPITEEQRKEIMHFSIMTYILTNGYEQIENWNEFKMLLDFVPMDNLPINPEAIEFLEKYGLEKITESGLDFKYLFKDKKITNLEEIANIDGIELKDIKKLVPRESKWILDKYEAKQLLEYGIKDLTELLDTTNDLYKIKEMLEKRPADLVNLGNFQTDKIRFIEKYGIDNIIALDEETNGMFSHELWGNDIYLTMFAQSDLKITRLNSQEELIYQPNSDTYQQFREKMYEILLHSRDGRGTLTSGDYETYDFIQGPFREEHSDIFIDGDLPENIKKAFYLRRMTAEMIRQNPELIQILQGKDLSRAFSKTMVAGILNEIREMSQDGEVKDWGIPYNVIMAQYLSERIGQEEFLKICADYGKCLDDIFVMAPGEISVESIRETIEKAIYTGIKEKGIEYFEELPESFKEKHPELFLPEEIDEEIRNKFYAGRLSYSDIRKNSQIKELLLTKDIDAGFRKLKYFTNGTKVIRREWEVLTEQEIMDLAEEYGDYLRDVDSDIFVKSDNIQDRNRKIRDRIEENILTRKRIETGRFGTPRVILHSNSPFNEEVPDFFKEKYPEMFLEEDAPEELKECFYDGGPMNFLLIKAHPEWREFLKGKQLSRAFSEEYNELFKRFDSATILKLGTRSSEIIEKMVENHKEDILQSWFKATGGKYVPHHVVMLNFPEGEMDSFLQNTKRWTQLMKLERYNLNDDGKSAMLKAAYAMGVFHENDDGFNKIMKLFSDVPQELTQEEYNKVSSLLQRFGPDSDVWGDIEFDNETIELFEKAYTPNDEGKYIFRLNKQKDKEGVKKIREILEMANLPKILTPQKAHQIFDSFKMEYNPDFVTFFNENIEQILSNPEYTKDIATIQRQFKDIVRTNAGRRLTLDVAQDYIKSIAYTDIEIGNEGVAEQAKIAGYSQRDFEIIQNLFDEGETREFSSIPRIKGEKNGFTYEMLKLDDPLALTIGTLTDCCQEIHGAGQTSMEHSVVSPDGRVFCVKDEQGRVVAQSWFWRNQYTGCFDNIEIPYRMFVAYNKEHENTKDKDLTKEVLEVYKKAAQDLMQEDERVYQELLENGTISQEQYNALLLGKVTIGLGYNDIADAIKADKTIHIENDEVGVKSTERLPHPYTDASIQYTIAEREGIVKSDYENLYVHQDEIPVYDGTNMPDTVFFTMKRMEATTARDNLAYITEIDDEEKLSKSQRIINGMAREYGLEPNDTKVMATARMALIYSIDKDNNVIIGDLLSSPLKKELTEEQQKKATEHIKKQVKKALKQINIQETKVNLSLLTEEQQQILQSIIKEIEQENSRKEER